MPVTGKDKRNMASPAPERTKKAVKVDSSDDEAPDSPRTEREERETKKEETKASKKPAPVDSDDEASPPVVSKSKRVAVESDDEGRGASKVKRSSDDEPDSDSESKKSKKQATPPRDPPKETKEREERKKKSEPAEVTSDDEGEKPKEKETRDRKKKASSERKEEKKPRSSERKKSSSDRKETRDIIPRTNKDDPTSVKLERYKVSIDDFDPERVVVGEANPIPVEIKDDAGKVQKLTHYSHTMEYKYKERPMYTPDSVKKGTYPAEKSILVLGALPALCSKSGFNEINGKYYYYMTLEPSKFAPKNATEEEKEQMLLESEQQLALFKTKMERMGIVIGEQLAALQLDKKCFINDLWDKQELKKGKKVIINNPGNVISEYVRWQKRNDEVDTSLPQVLKLSLNKNRRGNIDASVVTFSDKVVLPPKEWDSAKSQCLTVESDILFPQIYCTADKVYLQTLARSTMIVDAKETVSNSTQNERANYWSNKDSTNADSVRKQLQAAQQKIKEKVREKENAGKEETQEDIDADKVSGGDILNSKRIDMGKSSRKKLDTLE